MALKFQYSVNRTQIRKLRKKFENLEGPITHKRAKEAGKKIIEAMKRLISKGISPIMGRGKFDAYRGQYRKRIQKYGRVNGYSKKLRPVNLKLSGRFLDSLRHTVFKSGKGFAVNVGFYDKKSKDMEEGHRIGWNGQAERPIIPQAGERFAKSVEDAYLEVFDDAVGDATD